MITRFLILVSIFLAVALRSKAQQGYDRKTTLHPIQYTGVHKIIKLHVQVDTSDPIYRFSPPKDTSAVDSVDNYGRIIQDTSSTGTSKFIYTYERGQVSNRKRYCCTDTLKLNEEVHYYYDKRGWIVAEATSRYTVPSGLYWHPLPSYDSSIYHYTGDSLYTIYYVPGNPPDTFVCLWRLNRSGQLLATYRENKQKKYFEGEYYTYDKKGCVIEYVRVSNRSPVQKDGVVLFADHVVYSYDARSWPKEEWHYALGKLRSKYRYVYVK